MESQVQLLRDPELKKSILSKIKDQRNLRLFMLYFHHSTGTFSYWKIRNELAERPNHRYRINPGSAD